SEVPFMGPGTVGGGDLTVYARAGAIWRGRPVHMNASSTWLAARTNPRRVTGPIGGALKGSHVFIGLSGPGVVAPRDLKRMARNAIVFALANPVPEVRPEDLPRNVTVTATGRSDYPNQINNALAFPGVFRGALDVRARSITEPMKLAAARALAATVAPAELDRDYIVPSVFNPKVVPALAAAVRAAARRGGIARRSGG
ncbi:MAG: malic enzyme-like NAD(P)-binding protein, partial [bacterium]